MPESIPSAASADARITTIIEARNGRLLAYMRELYAFRELFGFLIWKDVKIQTAETVLGLGWLVLRPLLNVLVLTFIFGRLARIPTGDTPYLLFALSGFVIWTYFSGASGKAAGSLVGNSALLNKVYFPRLYLPLSHVFSGLLELTVMLVVFWMIAGIGYGRLPGVELLWLPVPLLLAVLSATGFGLWLSALSVDYRDVRHASGYLLQMMMFVAPVIWPVSLISTRLGIAGESFLSFYVFYPAVGMVEGCRYALLGGAAPPWHLVWPGYVTAMFLVVSGFINFRRRERRLADSV